MHSDDSKLLAVFLGESDRVRLMEGLVGNISRRLGTADIVAQQLGDRPDPCINRRVTRVKSRATYLQCAQGLLI